MRNEIILREFMQKIWNEKNFSSIPAFVHDRYTIYLDTGDPWEGKVLGHKSFEARLNYTFHSFPDVHFEIKHSMADGDYVAILWIMTGTNLGNIGDIPPTNKSIKTFGSTIYHFNDDKICGHHQVFDRASVTRQLGYHEELA